LIITEQEKKDRFLETIQKKMMKQYDRPDMLRCIPIIWHEITNLKGRVQDVLATLSAKRVRDEKLVDFKKQVVSNKSLKEYFKNNPQEKEVL
jgi:hypothetical protein